MQAIGAPWKAILSGAICSTHKGHLREAPRLQARSAKPMVARSLKAMRHDPHRQVPPRPLIRVSTSLYLHEGRVVVTHPVAGILDRAADLIEPEGRWVQGNLFRLAGG